MDRYPAWMAAPLAPGLHLVHKPAGPSSHGRMREFQSDRSPPLCHGGTLDPFAEGLLPILAGDATRLFPYLHDIPKVYEAEVIWGAETDNGDPGGTVTQRGARPYHPDVLVAALRGFIGWSDQVPPTTSNKRVDGERAYQKAWRGEEMEMVPVKAYLHAATWIEHELPDRSRLRLTCRGGYYVRSLVRDLGRTLGFPAHLGGLRRTAIGPWLDPGPARNVRVQGAALLPWCPWVKLEQDDLDQIRAGHPLPPMEIKPPNWNLPEGFPEADSPIRAVHDGRLFGLLRRHEGTLKAERVFRRGL